MFWCCQFYYVDLKGNQGFSTFPSTVSQSHYIVNLKVLQVSVKHVWWYSKLLTSRKINKLPYTLYITNSHVFLTAFSMPFGRLKVIQPKSAKYAVSYIVCTPQTWISMGYRIAFPEFLILSSKIYIPHDRQNVQSLFIFLCPRIPNPMSI